MRKRTAARTLIRASLAIPGVTGEERAKSPGIVQAMRSRLGRIDQHVCRGAPAAVGPSAALLAEREGLLSRLRGIDAELQTLVRIILSDRPQVDFRGACPDDRLLVPSACYQPPAGTRCRCRSGAGPPLAQPAGGELQRGAVRAYTSTRPHNLKIYREYLLKRLLL